MTIVVDASVAIKWLLNDPVREAETEQATLLMECVIKGQEHILQPAHWLLEVGAVLAHVSPESAEDDLTMLQAMNLPMDDDPLVLRLACRMAIDLRQHLFDTLYHAVALETPDTTLITADEKYLRASAALGHVQSLTEWRPPE